MEQTVRHTQSALLYIPRVATPRGIIVHSHTFLSARVFPCVSFAVLGDFLLPPVVVATFTAVNITFKVNLTITSMHT